MRLETERLLITRFRGEMAQAVQENSVDEDMRRFLPDEVFETVDEAAGTIEFLMSRYEGREGPFVFPVLLKDGTNIGYVQAVLAESGVWEAGYHIAKQFTGNGYATEALRAFVLVIMKKLNLGRIYGICHAQNAASCRVLEKCGFCLEYDGEGQYQGKTIRIKKYVLQKNPA